MNEESIKRSRICLEGLNIGDCFGATFFVGFGKVFGRLRRSIAANCFSFG